MVVTHRRNFLPSFILNLILWGGVAYLIFYLQPNRTNIVLFFTSLTLALTLTLALILGNTRRAFFLTLFIDGFLLLQLVKLFTWLNLVLLLVILLTLELYSSHRQIKK